MNRVVVTGLGIVSSIGSTIDTVTHALRHNVSGLTCLPEMLDAGFRCCVFGQVNGFDQAGIPKRCRQTMSTGAMYAASAAIDAAAEANIDFQSVDTTRIGVFVGSEFGGINEVCKMYDCLTAGKKSRAGAVGVVKFMNSTASGNIAAMFTLKGPACSLSSSFATGTDNIGHAFELIRRGRIDAAVCGSTEEPCWLPIGPYFNNWGGLPEGYNHRPEQACRPYDAERKGLILSAGAGILILESLEYACQRKADILAEVIGYGSANDGSDLFRPSGSGLANAIRQAVSLAGNIEIDYINSHGTGTLLGDRMEMATLKDILPNHTPISSTKGQTGHALGACGAIESIFTIIMLTNNFIAPTMNLVDIDPACTGLKHIQDTRDAQLNTVMNFNVGLAGANSCLIFRRFE